MSQPRSILITGASSGIGAALARHYAAAGVVLHLTGRDSQRLGETVAACEALGATCHASAFDVRDDEALSAWLDTCLDAPIDLAILNAGLAATRSSPVEGERLTEMMAQMDVNLRATLVAAQTIGSAMARRGSGRLALMSSLNGLYPVVEAPTYSATKAGIVAYGHAITDWLEPLGVGVSVICPGFVRSRISERYDGPRPLEMSAEKPLR